VEENGSGLRGEGSREGQLQEEEEEGMLSDRGNKVEEDDSGSETKDKLDAEVPGKQGRGKDRRKKASFWELPVSSHPKKETGDWKAGMQVESGEVGVGGMQRAKHGDGCWGYCAESWKEFEIQLCEHYH
jgi:hypothetical protein